jgi:hypothetical protein
MTALGCLPSTKATDIPSPQLAGREKHSVLKHTAPLVLRLSCIWPFVRRAKLPFLQNMPLHVKLAMAALGISHFISGY